MIKRQQTIEELDYFTQYAGFTKRLIAFGFDCLMISGYIIFLTAVRLAIINITGFLRLPFSWPESQLIAEIMAFVTLVLPVILYFALQESSSHQATWGKRKAGLRVINLNGGALTRTQAFMRSIVKFLPWQIAHTCIFNVEGWPLEVTTLSPLVVTGFAMVYVLVGIYIASALISKKHRTLYDLISGAFVVCN